ncbi:MAG: xanthine dehydrogenase [Alphaproteobacteria bacterium]|nr:xanthine dehydrogenase [Alphaproteobacteria bacterium]
MKATTLETLQRDRAAKRAVALLSDLDSNEERLVYPDSPTSLATVPPAVAEAIKIAAIADRSGVVKIAGKRFFINVYNPPLRMIVVGAVHIAQPLARMALLAGYEVIIVDPRRSFATAVRFPDVTVLSDWPDDALATLAPDPRTAIVTLTHDPKIDDPALNLALKSSAFYIGALGSRKTHAARLKRMELAGFTATETARIRGPVGLSIGARSPAEIAISVLAQVTETLRQPATDAGGARSDPAADAA